MNIMNIGPYLQAGTNMLWRGEGHFGGQNLESCNHPPTNSKLKNRFAQPEGFPNLFFFRSGLDSWPIHGTSLVYLPTVYINVWFLDKLVGGWTNPSEKY